MSNNYEKTRSFYLTHTTKQRVKEWKKDLENKLSRFLPAESFFRLLLENRKIITEQIVQDQYQGEFEE